MDPFGCKYSWNVAEEDRGEKHGCGPCGRGLKPCAAPWWFSHPPKTALLPFAQRVEQRPITEALTQVHPRPGACHFLLSPPVSCHLLSSPINKTIKGQKQKPPPVLSSYVLIVLTRRGRCSDNLEKKNTFIKLCMYVKCVCVCVCVCVCGVWCGVMCILHFLQIKPELCSRS